MYFDELCGGCEEEEESESESSSCDGGGMFGGDDSDDDDSDDSNCDHRTRSAVTQSVVKPKPNVEAAMVSVAERTQPVYRGKELQKVQVQSVTNSGTVRCVAIECRKEITSEEWVYHCAFDNGRIYNLCIECGDKQLLFDELRGLLDEDKHYKLERNEDYPVRVTLQYYKATDNGAVNKEIMDDIVRQIEASQKQADFMGSLVNEYDPNRPTEWYGKPKGDDSKEEVIVNGDDPFSETAAALQEFCSNQWMDILQKFQDEDVKDSDLKFLEDNDLQELIPKIGPRNRFKCWSRWRTKLKNRPSYWYGFDGDTPKDDDVKEDDIDEFAEIRTALQECCGNECQSISNKFVEEDVKDSDLKLLSNVISKKEMKQLIPKIGPRNRFKNWMRSKFGKGTGGVVTNVDSRPNESSEESSSAGMSGIYPLHMFERVKLG